MEFSGHSTKIHIETMEPEIITKASPQWLLRCSKDGPYAVLRHLDCAQEVLEHAKVSCPDLRLRFKTSPQVRLWWSTLLCSESGNLSGSATVPAEVRIAVETALYEIRTCRAAKKMAQDSACKLDEIEKTDTVHLDVTSPCAARVSDEAAEGNLATGRDHSDLEVPATAIAIPLWQRETLTPLRSLQPPTVSQMCMPKKIREALPEVGGHSEFSLAFALYARSRSKDDWVAWVSPTVTLDEQVADAIHSAHATEQFRARWSEARRVELLRCLRSGDGGAYRATARCARVAVLLDTGVLLEFAKPTRRLLSMKRDERLRPNAQEGPIPHVLAVALQKGVKEAALGVAPGFGDANGPALDPETAAAAQFALETGVPRAWWEKSTLKIVTTTAILVMSDAAAAVATRDTTPRMSFITLIPCEDKHKFSAWKKLHRRDWRMRLPVARHPHPPHDPLADSDQED
jgi:hypothetical protein